MLNPLKILWLTLSDTHSYARFGNRSFRDAILYAAIMYFICAIGYGSYVALKQLPLAIHISENAITSLLSSYPPNLTLTISDDTLTVAGVPEPVTIPFTNPNPAYTNVMVINTNAVAEQIKDQSTLLFLTSKAVSFAWNPENKTAHLIPWSQVGLTGKFTADQVATTVAKIQAYLEKGKPYFLPLSILFAYGVLLLLRLPFWLLHSLILTYLFRLLGKHFPYVLVLKTGLYILVLTELLWAVLNLIYPEPSPSLFTLAYYLTTYFALSGIIVLNLKPPVSR